MTNEKSIKTQSPYKKKCLFVLALGGTIASVAQDATGEFYKSAVTTINELIALLPIDNKTMTIKSEQFIQKISHDITYDDLIAIATKINEIVNDNNVDGLVVVQGTNSIEEVSYFINLVINTKKTIIFTGAFRPLNALGYDGARNLYNALLIASNSLYRNVGVLLTFNDCIVSARDAYKLNPSVLGDFATSDTGKMGFIQGTALSLQKQLTVKHTYLSEFDISKITCLEKIYIIYGCLGLASDIVDLAIEKGIKGIISAGLGKGYQPVEVNKALYKASQHGIIVVRCSRTGQGIINYEPNFDDKYGFVAGGSLSPHKASILLAVALSKTTNIVSIQRLFNEY